MKCKDCINYNASKLDIKNPTFGECYLIDYYRTEDALLIKDKVIVLDGGRYDLTVVGEDFGCIHFKQK